MQKENFNQIKSIHDMTKYKSLLTEHQHVFELGKSFVPKQLKAHFRRWPRVQFHRHQFGLI